MTRLAAFLLAAIETLAPADRAPPGDLPETREERAARHEAFALALARPPDEADRTAARRFFASQPASAQEGGEPPLGLLQFCQALLNVNEFAYLD